MAPFPHSAPRATISAENPAGTDGFELVEFAHADPGALREVFLHRWVPNRLTGQRRCMCPPSWVSAGH